jgi:hypothetical protein
MGISGKTGAPIGSRRAGRIAHAPAGVLDGPATAIRPVSAARMLTNMVRAATIHIQWLRAGFRGVVPERMSGCPGLVSRGAGDGGELHRAASPVPGESDDFGSSVWTGYGTTLPRVLKRTRFAFSERPA